MARTRFSGARPIAAWLAPALAAAGLTVANPYAAQADPLPGAAYAGTTSGRTINLGVDALDLATITAGIGASGTTVGTALRRPTRSPSRSTARLPGHHGTIGRDNHHRQHPLGIWHRRPGALTTVRNGEATIGTMKVGPDGTWSVSPTAAQPDGPTTLTATQQDPAGNVSPPSTVHFRVETSGGSLAHTGANVLALAEVAGLLLLGGCLMLMTRSRRRNTPPRR